jgi:competence protein ComEC
MRENAWEKIWQKHRTKLVVLVLALLALDAEIWFRIANERGEESLRTHFLDVGQGDSELIELPGSVQILVDGGPANGRALAVLGGVLAPEDRYLDIVVLSHSESDHFGGLIDILRRYRVGAFVWNGVPGTAGAYADLMKAVRESGARVAVVGAGDAIVNGDSRIDVISPAQNISSNTDTNDTSLVIRVTAGATRALFTGDIGPKVEAALAPVVGRADILKVSHHGSKFSTSESFLEAVRPLVAGIEVGENNYGHPAPETLARLVAAGAQVFRTDRNSTVEVVSDGGRLRVFAE